MARIRSVHPNLCISEQMAALPANLERTFVRLWTHCDDQGRCVDNARLIKAGIYPLHDDMTPDVLERELEALASAGLIVRYAAHANGAFSEGSVSTHGAITEPSTRLFRVVQVVAWPRYQHPNRAAPSILPPPPPSLPSGQDSGLPADVSAGQDSFSEGSVSTHGALSEPSVRAHGLELGEGEGEGEGEGVPIAPPARKRKRDPIWDALMAACGISVTIPAGPRGAYNRAVKELRDIGVDPAEIPRRAAVYRARWPSVSLTPTALVRRWAECEPRLEHLPRAQLSPAEAAALRLANEDRGP